MIRSYAACLIFAAVGIGSLVAASLAQAETLYTTLQDTPVRDKPIALGSTVTAHLPTGSMLETVKEVGAFTAVSFIQDGKVKTGFIATQQIKNDPDHKMGVAEAAQTGVGSEDVASMVSGLTDADPQTAANDKVQSLKSANLPPGAEDPQSLLTSKLDSMQVPAADLSSFAKNGKLVSRKPKAKVAQ